MLCIFSFDTKWNSLYITARIWGLFYCVHKMKFPITARIWGLFYCVHNKDELRVLAIVIDPASTGQLFSIKLRNSNSHWFVVWNEDRMNKTSSSVLQITWWIIILLSCKEPNFFIWKIVHCSRFYETLNGEGKLRVYKPMIQTYI